jgi:predicted membrane protein
MKSANYTGNHSNRMWSGLIVLIIGIVFLLSNFGIDMPHWVFSWHTILLVIGLVVGFKRNFNGRGWLVMVLIGGYFTLEDMAGIDLSKYYFAFAFIALGLFLILRPKKTENGKWKKKMADFSSVDTAEAGEERPSENDFVDSVNVFGGSKQHVFSKNFRGGDVISIFGGCELNLTQADFKDSATLEVVAIFGGMKIIVPPTWEVKSEVTAIFGGIDDKRSVVTIAGPVNKIIKINGVALFGGLTIANY